MAEKRRHRRFPKRLAVRFGQGETLSHSGFLVDVSAGGMFIVAQTLPPLDARLHVQVTTEDKRVLYWEARVQRHKLVPPELRAVTRAGFAVKILTPEELVSEIIPRSAAKGQELRCVYRSLEELQSVFEKEIKFGGLFVRTPKKFAQDAEIQLRIELPFAEKQVMLDAKVVHVAHHEVAGGGVGLLFADRQTAISELTKYVRPS